MLKKYPINKKDNLFYLKKEDIENETQNLLLNYCNECLETPMPTPIENLIYYLDINLDYANLFSFYFCYRNISKFLFL